jgi:hypothetical protein
MGTKCGQSWRRTRDLYRMWAAGHADFRMALDRAGSCEWIRSARTAGRGQNALPPRKARFVRRGGEGGGRGERPRFPGVREMAVTEGLCLSVC